ncbi:hypothetical protein GCM10011349_12070 [Novosphingobium indicum]|uniref:Uncharacterized protein n=1 Tax=Novosphingobium indicum TaxID=462949 RepID=A0ABQ2JHT4_9SPHN|nr:hypothetical protein GCM10011349_12070 [Novosphingobium indicum]
MLDRILGALEKFGAASRALFCPDFRRMRHRSRHHAEDEEKACKELEQAFHCAAPSNFVVEWE